MQPGKRREITFDSDGARLWALETGAGEPLVFLHGGLADHRAALFHLGPLAATHRLVTPDLRGSGRSLHRGGSLTWDRLADDIAALLTHLGIERANVGGTSMGSSVAVRFALRHPERLRGLVLMAPVHPGADRGLSEAQQAAMRAMHEAGQRTLSEGVEALLPLYESLPEPIRAVARTMARGFDPAGVAATTRLLASGAQPFETASELEAISAPVLIVPGSDPQHPPEVAARLARHLDAIIVEPTSPGLVARIAAFCDGARPA